MLSRYSALAALSAALFLLLPLSHAGVVGTASIYAPAVVLSNNTGTLTRITLTIFNGTGAVSVSGAASVANSTQQSARTAAYYACAYTSKSCTKYDFTYDINDTAVNVSGPSAGAAMTLLAVSALTHRQLPTGFTITGTINSSGDIGLIGGVYDKVGAAKKNGMNFVIVPASTGYEDALYYLVQTTFNIPLVQASNITQAWQLINSSAEAAQHESTFNTTVDYHTSSIIPTSLNCSDKCNTAAFGMLVNSTLLLASSEISATSGYGIHSGIASMLSGVLDQSRAVAQKGYLYTAADLAYLDYINAYYFAHHNITIYGAQNEIYNVSSACSSLIAPQYNTNNYEFVVSGELRQLWGTYTITAVNSSLNTSQQPDTDQALYDIYLAGQASGWCNAAYFMYNISNMTSGTPLVQSAALQSIASARLNSTLKYGTNLYTATARQAYNKGEYAAAILDAGYANAFGPQIPINYSTQQLLALAAQHASNATYGVWATEFAKESQFYAQESNRSSQNATLAHTYAIQAYSSALLGSIISNDTAVISANLNVAAASTTRVNTTTAQQTSQQTSLYQTQGLALQFTMLLIIVSVLLLLVCVGLTILILIYFKMRNTNKRNKRKRRR